MSVSFMTCLCPGPPSLDVPGIGWKPKEFAHSRSFLIRARFLRLKRLRGFPRLGVRLRVGKDRSCSRQPCTNGFIYRKVAIRIRILAVVLTGIALAPALAHAFEFPGKMRLERGAY